MESDHDNYEPFISEILEVIQQDSVSGLVEIYKVPFLLEPGASKTYWPTANQRIETGRTLLDEAARHNALLITRFLLDHGAKVNALNAQKQSALMVAVREGRLEVCRPLVEAGADLTTIDGRQASLMGAAVGWGHLNVVKYLVEEVGLDINAPSYAKQWPPLCTAAVFDKPDIARYLLGREGIDVNGRDGDGDTALADAASCNGVEIVQMLLERKDVDRRLKNWTGEDALFMALELQCGVAFTKEREHAAQILFETGDYDVNEAVSCGCSLLSRAASLGNVNLVKLFLDGGAVGNIRHSNNETCKKGALYCRQYEDAHCKDVAGDTPLIAAARYGHLKVVEILIGKKGVDINEKNDKGETALGLAVKLGHSEIAEFLGSHTQQQTEEKHCEVEEVGIIMVDLKLTDKGQESNENFTDEDSDFVMIDQEEIVREEAARKL